MQAPFLSILISHEWSTLSSSVAMTSTVRELYLLLQVSACALLLLASILKKKNLFK